MDNQGSLAGQGAGVEQGSQCGRYASLRQGFARGYSRAECAQPTPLYPNLLSTPIPAAISQPWHAVFAWGVSYPAAVSQRTAAGMVPRRPTPASRPTRLWFHQYTWHTDHTRTVHELRTPNPLIASTSAGETQREADIGSRYCGRRSRDRRPRWSKPCACR